MSVYIAGVLIVGNEVDITISSSARTESLPKLLRDTVLNSPSITGNRPIEVETLSGKRVLMQVSTGTYNTIPINNDSLILSFSSDLVYNVTTVTVSGTAVDAIGLDSLSIAMAESQQFYTNRRILLNKINDSSLTYTARKAFITEYMTLTGGNVNIIVPGFTGKGDFVESNGLNVSYWANGPYADVKVTVESKKLIQF